VALSFNDTTQIVSFNIAQLKTKNKNKTKQNKKTCIDSNLIKIGRTLPDLLLSLFLLSPLVAPIVPRSKREGNSILFRYLFTK